jgi:nucleotide-binding universal stress UspA family protein
MGAALELGKITATVWLHKYWHKANIQFKLYLIPAIIVLMLITSMGIFGFLSKAHMDQNITVGDSAAQVQILDEKIKTEQDNISVNKRALQQMDAQVDQMLGRTTDDKGANRAVQIRKNQAKERKSLQADITAAQKNISALQAERAPLAAQNRKIEAEVGPIKYIAALIYGDNPNADLLERAVRWVIILLVFVFDPLALILILAAEQTIVWSRREKEERKGWHQEWVPDTEAWPEWDDSVTEEQIEAIKETANVEDVSMTERLFDTEEEFFAHGKEVAQELDQQAEDSKPFDFSKHAYLNGPVSWFKSTTNEGWVPKQEHDPLDIPVLENEETWAQRAIDERARLEQTEKDLANAILLIQEKEQELATIKKQQTTIPNFDLTVDDADNVLSEGKSTNAGFGTSFPNNPKRGDVYLRVDMLPNKPYKWNGNKWIELERSAIDRYVHENEYIKYLIDKVKSGEYDFHELTKAEQEEVLKNLDYKTRSDL